MMRSGLNGRVPDWRVATDDSETVLAPDHERQIERNVARIARQHERQEIADAAWDRTKSATFAAIDHVPGTRDEVTGRKELFPEPSLVEFG